MLDNKQQNTTDTGSIPIWNPNAAANWCLIFSPVFGTYIHMANWNALNEPKKAAESKIWFYISLVFLGLVMFSVFLPESKTVDGIFRSAGIGLLFGWYFTSARDQVKYVKENLGENYVKKSWWKPLLIGIVCLVGFFITTTILLMIFGNV